MVIHKSDKEQGNGFYKLCQSIFEKNWEDLKADKNFENQKSRNVMNFGVIQRIIRIIKMTTNKLYK